MKDLDEEYEEAFGTPPVKRNKKKGVIETKTVWITGDGRELSIEDMETSHIINCVAKINRAIGDLSGLTDNTTIRREVQKHQLNINQFLQELDRREKA